MRILLDECVNPRVRQAFAGADVRTVREMGWGGVTNGELLKLAQAEAFTVFVTVDRNLQHQQRVANLTMGIIVVTVPDNHIRFFRPVFDQLSDAANEICPGQVIHVVSLGR